MCPKKLSRHKDSLGEYGFISESNTRADMSVANIHQSIVNIGIRTPTDRSNNDGYGHSQMTNPIRGILKSESCPMPGVRVYQGKRRRIRFVEEVHVLHHHDEEEENDDDGKNDDCVQHIICEDDREGIVHGIVHSELSGQAGQPITADSGLAAA